MAINPLSLCEISECSLLVKSGPGRRILRVDHDGDGKVIKRSRKKIKSMKSPYLHAGDKIQFLSSITEKRMEHKRERRDLPFSNYFPNLCRANSDEFKGQKPKPCKKVKKSVLTLPNEQILMPQTCTVSDLNEAEYQRKNKKASTTVKRVPLPNKRKRPVPKEYEFFDRDARYLSEMDLDTSSTDLILKHRQGDGNRRSRNSRNHKKQVDKEREVQPHDVWAVLRDINRFQFNPSPPISVGSISSTKRMVSTQRTERKGKGNRRLIETCRTQEISYVANIEYETTTASPQNIHPQCASRSSSGDRVTVVDKKELDFCTGNVKEIANAIEKRIQDKNPKNKILATNNVVKDFEKNRNKMAPGDTDDNKMKTKKNEEKHQSSSNVSFDSSNYYLNMHLGAGDKTVSAVRDNALGKRRAKDLPIWNNRTTPKIDPSSPNCLKDAVYRQGTRFLKDGNIMTKLAKAFLVTKENNINSKENTVSDPQKQRPRLVTTMPSGTAMPKLDVGDIRKKLGYIRFPLTVLGKDQVSSEFEVIDHGFSQFDGLDKHIWPFMSDWNIKVKPKTRSGQSNNHNFFNLNNKAMKDLKKVSNDISINKPHKDKTLRNITAENFGNKKGVCQRSEKLLDITENTSDESQTPVIVHKAKPNNVRQFRDKMIKLIYKKPSDELERDEEYQIGTKPELNIQKTEKDNERNDDFNISQNVHRSTNAKIDISTDPMVVKTPSPIQPTKPCDIMTNLNKSNKIQSQSVSSRQDLPLSTLSAIRRQPWAKGKWANDFIDNIITKVRCGIYYIPEDSPRDTTSNIKKVEFIDNGNVMIPDSQIDSKDVSLQTPKSFKSPDMYDESCMGVVTLPESRDLLKTIPGFDDTLPGLEIKSLNMNQIAVKQCTTNIMVQFDVKIFDKSDAFEPGIRESECLCIPLTVTENHTQIFKYNTSILNAVLPAQLCTLLPRLICNQIITKNTMRRSNLLSLEDTSSELSLISERSLSKIPVHLVQLPLQIFEYMSPVLKQLLAGKFSGKTMFVFRRFTNITSLIRRSDRHTKFVEIPKVIPQRVIICLLEPTLNLRINSSKPITKCDTVLPILALQPVSASKLQPVSASKLVEVRDFKAILGMMAKHYDYQLKFNLPTFVSPVKLTCYNDSIKIDVMVENQGLLKAMSLTVDNTALDSLFNGYKERKTVTENDDCPLHCIEYNSAYRTGMCVTEQLLPSKTKRKNRPNRYIRLYKKCKSTSNIVIEKSGGSLNKITTLEDFFQCLGSAKTLASVFDGPAGIKILSAVSQMKNWITKITPRQALLVLLLINKKETPNLVRFHPILLQGIAMNRITRASELDMEIEVIENENMKLVTYNDTLNFPTPIAKRDSLYEELQWIAKTTASDYNKPFDESSQDLLRALLEKRKKLNPSYLRVMARYVGLGLLKSPIKR